MKDEASNFYIGWIVGLLFLWLLSSCAHAQEPTERDRLLGIAKLKKAAEIRGAMDGGFFDADRLICYELKSSTGASFFECMQPEEFKTLLPDNKPVPFADRVLTPPPVDCKKVHGVRKDDRCGLR